MRHGREQSWIALDLRDFVVDFVGLGMILVVLEPGEAEAKQSVHESTNLLHQHELAGRDEQLSRQLPTSRSRHVRA